MLMDTDKLLKKFSSTRLIYQPGKMQKMRLWFAIISIIFIVFLFLPWTQNVQSKGTVIARSQSQRMQEVNAPFSGRVAKWNVKEGDIVKIGDTIIQLAEIKEEYLDPNLVDRTKQQANAKIKAIESYENKAIATQSQVEALKRMQMLKSSQLDIKLKQLENKLQAEKVELSSVENEFQNAKDQYERLEKLYNQGLSSQTQLQQRNTLYQNALAKKTLTENKIFQTTRDIQNTQLEQMQNLQEYSEKINKAEAQRFEIEGLQAQSAGELSKLNNQVSNYMIRSGMYFIIATQNGQIVQAKKSGIGETVKEGENICSIVPEQFDKSIEMFVRPIDLPLIQINQQVRVNFDGYPAIVFRGWPNQSYGTFDGKIVAIENSINDDGFFRVLVLADESKKKWPPFLRIGTGTNCIILLNNVPIWYEFWRNINGFPPDFYNKTNNKK